MVESSQSHQDAALLVLRHDDLQHAQELCEGRRRQQRGAVDESREKIVGNPCGTRVFYLFVDFF